MVGHVYMVGESSYVASSYIILSFVIAMNYSVRIGAKEITLRNN